MTVQVFLSRKCKYQQYTMQKSHGYLNYIKIDIKIEIKNMLTSSLQRGKLIKTYETGEGDEVAFETA